MQDKKDQKPKSEAAESAFREGSRASGRDPKCFFGGRSTGVPPSNTTPAKYIEDLEDEKTTILRYGIDSLYLSYPGLLGSNWDQRLSGLKEAAKGSDAAKAQVKIGDHLFEVSDRGKGKFAYILKDNWFIISLSSHSATNLPLAYVQVSSELLTAIGASEAEKRLRHIVNTFGLVEKDARVSRADLFVDFVTTEDLEAIEGIHWSCRASESAKYYCNRKLSGWGIGYGGDIAARLYNKTLELKKSKKDYLKPLWNTASWDGTEQVWRLEFQFKRTILKEFGVGDFEPMLDNLATLWAYATGKWLRLTIPNANDDNQARWPNHPLWTYLSIVNWNLPPQPPLTRVRRERVPPDDILFINGLGGLTSFMAKEGITDLAEGFGEFIAHAHRYHNQKNRNQDKAFEDYVKGKVTQKGRKFNTLHQPNEDEEADKKTRKDNYKKAKDGE